MIVSLPAGRRSSRAYRRGIEVTIVSPPAGKRSCPASAARTPIMIRSLRVGSRSSPGFPSPPPFLSFSPYPPPLIGVRSSVAAVSPRPLYLSPWSEANR